jgi:hypothetical protein
MSLMSRSLTTILLDLELFSLSENEETQKSCMQWPLDRTLTVYKTEAKCGVEADKVRTLGWNILGDMPSLYANVVNYLSADLKYTERGSVRRRKG